MDMRAIKSPYSPAPESRLQAVALDVHLLQRQLVLILTDEDQSGGDETLALMVACCICDRLATGRMLLQGSRTAFEGYFDAAGTGAARLNSLVRGAPTMGPEPSSELIYDAELVQGLGLPRMHRLRAMDTVAARVARELLFATGLFLAAAEPSPVRIEPAFHPDVYLPSEADEIRLTA